MQVSGGGAFLAAELAERSAQTEPPRKLGSAERLPYKT